MHIVHLALAPDTITSLLMDWTDDQVYFNETSREKRLAKLWKSYRECCESAGVTDRAQRKLFSTSVLGADEENTLRSVKRSSTRYLLDRITGTARWVDAQTCVSFSPRKLEKIVPIRQAYIFVQIRWVGSTTN